MALACSVCDAPHDFDLTPDDGTCVVCGGALTEDPKERALVCILPKADKRVAKAILEGVDPKTVVQDQEHEEN